MRCSEKYQKMITNEHVVLSCWPKRTARPFRCSRSQGLPRGYGGILQPSSGGQRWCESNPRPFLEKTWTSSAAPPKIEMALLTETGELQYWRSRNDSKKFVCFGTFDLHLGSSTSLPKFLKNRSPKWHFQEGIRFDLSLLFSGDSLCGPLSYLLQQNEFWWRTSSTERTQFFLPLLDAESVSSRLLRRCLASMTEPDAIA